MPAKNEWLVDDDARKTMASMLLRGSETPLLPDFPHPKLLGPTFLCVFNFPFLPA